MSMSGHLGDRLSALLDGELEYAEAAAAATPATAASGRMCLARRAAAIETTGAD